MLEGSQKLLHPWSLMSNVKLFWMIVNGHFCQRCHVRWFLTAYWRVRAWVDAKCSFFPPRLMWRSIQTIFIHFFNSASQSPRSPFFLTHQGPILLNLRPRHVFLKMLVSYGNYVWRRSGRRAIHVPISFHQNIWYGAASPLLQHASMNQEAKQKMDNEALDLTLDVTKWI